MLSRLLILFVSGITVLGCGAPGDTGALSQVELTSDHSIFSGVEVQTQNEINSSIVLLSQKDLGTLCTGVLIDANVVLTAAHCASGTPELTVVLFTRNYFGKNIPVRTVKKFLINEDYKKIKGLDRRDMALVLFEGHIPAEFKPIRIASLAELAMTTKGQTSLSIIGFGFGSSDADQKYFGNPGVLRQAEFKSLDFVYSKPFFTIDQTSGPALCHGDSGGPGIVLVNEKPRLVGLASTVFGRPTSDKTTSTCRFRSLYMNVVALKPWIQKNIQELKISHDPK